jgi:hypothetical protein
MSVGIRFSGLIVLPFLIRIGYGGCGGGAGRGPGHLGETESPLALKTRDSRTRASTAGAHTWLFRSNHQSVSHVGHYGTAWDEQSGLRPESRSRPKLTVQDGWRPRTSRACRGASLRASLQVMHLCCSPNIRCSLLFGHWTFKVSRIIFSCYKDV